MKAGSIEAFAHGGYDMAHGHANHEADCNVPGRTYLSALVLLAIGCLLIACGFGGAESRDTQKSGAQPSPPGNPNAPAPPSGLTGAANGPFAANLSWQPSTDPTVTSYRLERCLGAGCSAFVLVISQTGTSFTDIGLSSASSYDYRVKASDAGANLSAASNVANVTTTAAPIVPPVVLPAWVSALSPGQWFEIPNTAMQNVEPNPVPPGNGPSSKVIAWTSFVVDTRTSKVYSPANGGHIDYAGNEVDVLDLERDQPVWTQVLAPTPANQITQCTSYYADDHPTSRHSYFGVTFNESQDRIMLIGGAWWCGAGGFHTAISSYNIGANSWSPSTTHGNVPGIYAGVAAYIGDPFTGDVYAGREFNFGRWNRSSNTFTTLNPSGSRIPALNGAMSAFDTTRGGILFLGLTGDFYKLSSNAWTQVALTGPNAGSIAGVTDNSMVYVAAIDSYLVRFEPAGGTVYQVNAANLQVTTMPTTGGASVPSTINGPYNKFLYVPRLRGVVYVPSYSGNVWFLRVH